jgi:pyruvate dehydrogenase E1 component
VWKNPLRQPDRTLTPDLAQAIVDGGYWLVPPGPDAELAIVACGAVVGEAIEAHRQIGEDLPATGLLVVTSADRLHSGWRAAERGGTPSHIDRLLAALPESAGLVTVIDAHPATLTWIAAVRRHAISALGVDRFGQSGDMPDLYGKYELDADAIIGAAARLLVRRA